MWGLSSLSAGSVNILVWVEDPAILSFCPARSRIVWLILQLVVLVEEVPCLWLGLSLTTASSGLTPVWGPQGWYTDPGFCSVITFNLSLSTLYWGPIRLWERGKHTTTVWIAFSFAFFCWNTHKKMGRWKKMSHRMEPTLMGVQWWCSDEGDQWRVPLSH